MDFVLELAKLIKTTPKLTLPMQECENSPYNSFLYRSRDCYLCFSSSYLDSCYYVDSSSHNKDCVDAESINNCELCYECLHCERCYNVDCSWWTTNCRDCMYCFCTQGCGNCFGCVYRMRREYCILNEQYRPEEYFKKVAEIRADLKQKGIDGKYLVMDAVEIARSL